MLVARDMTNMNQQSKPTGGELKEIKGELNTLLGKFEEYCAMKYSGHKVRVTQVNTDIIQEFFNWHTAKISKSTDENI